MITIDYILLIGFLLGIIFVGFVFMRRIKNARDMFTAGGRSPWWASGLSSFMTMFSAGTFVIWGGIAYKHGAVAISINMAYGIAAFLVGKFVASHWQRMGLTTVAEYVEARFGQSTVQIYTWLKGAILIFSTGAAIYAFSRIFCAIIPLSPEHILADPKTGNLSVTFASIAMGVVVLLYTMAGGLWAVLMTSVIQFIVLTSTVLMVVPLSIMRVGGIKSFIEKIPQGFLSPVSDEYSWLFLTGWVVVHFFMIGGEWHFVQRFLCVPTAKDARKSAYLFAVLYLISPFLWMLPPMIYRIINPNANHEEAYILMCKEVLPAGMIGLIIAAMFSATSSSVSSIINVFAGVYTHDFYYKFINPRASEKHLVWVGRLITMLLGVIIIIAALIIPIWGVTKFIILYSSLVTAPMLLPFVWGLFSKTINQRDVWITIFISAMIALIYKFSFIQGGFASDIKILKPLTELIQGNYKVADLVVGNITPLIVLILIECICHGKTSKGWKKIQNVIAVNSEKPIVNQNDAASLLPVKIVTISIAVLGASFVLLAVISKQGRATLASFAGLLLAISIVLGLYYFHKKKAY